jgi:hypothetical protein
MLKKKQKNFIEKHVRRFFDEKEYEDGIVVAFLPGEKNDGLCLWHVLYDDDDEEDLELHEVFF